MIEGDVGRGGPIRIGDLDVRDDLRRHGRTRRLLTDIGAPVGIDASLAERIEFEPALDPRESISEWRRHVVELVRIAPVQTGLQPAITRTDFVGPRSF